MRNLYILGPTNKNSEYIGLWQLHPFTLFKKELRDAGYNVIRKHARTCQEISNLTKDLEQPDIIAIRPDWTENPNDVLNLCKNLRDNYFDSKIIMIDPFDQSSSRFFESLPYLNAMVKYLSLKDKKLYLADYAAGVYAVQKLKDDFGVSPSDDWSVRSTVEKGQEHKIVTGSFCIEPKLIKKIKSPINKWLLGMKDKNISLFCHMSCGKRDDLEWYGKHRVKAVEQLKKLSRYNISVEAEYLGEPRISSKEYVKRLKASKLVYSPLGWGEVTMRAYEALANQSLLVQPDISHLDMFPNIFVPNETYIPVKWDLTDLAEKSEYYMTHEAEAAEIVTKAREAFLNEFTADRFISRFERIFNMEL
jgi:hypothetical protein